MTHLTLIAKKMKYTLYIFLLCIGFGSGWYFSNQRMEEKVKESFPPEMREMLDEVVKIVGPMEKEDVAEMLDLLESFGENAVKELDQMSLWRANTANQLLVIESNEGKEKADEYSNYLIQHFRTDYENGMNLGAWQEMADKVYESTNNLRSDPGGGINSVTSLRDSTP